MLTLYIGGGSEALNLEIRTDAVNKNSLQQRQRDVLDRVIDQHRLQADTVLYRGMWIKEQIEGTGLPKVDLVPGSIFTDKAFVSTSKEPKTASTFGDTLVEITASKGTKALDINRVLPQLADEWKQQEHEVILPRNSAFEVESYDATRNVLKVKLRKT